MDDRSVDVVTSRSVPIYVDRKDRRVQRVPSRPPPGGRLSIFEPINKRTSRCATTTSGDSTAAPVRE